MYRGIICIKHHKVLIKHNNDYTYDSTYFKHYRLQLHNYIQILITFYGAQGHHYDCFPLGIMYV